MTGGSDLSIFAIGPWGAETSSQQGLLDFAVCSFFEGVGQWEQAGLATAVFSVGQQMFESQRTAQIAGAIAEMRSRSAGGSVSFLSISVLLLMIKVYNTFSSGFDSIVKIKDRFILEK